jgi:hypothetical protein
MRDLGHTKFKQKRRNYFNEFMNYYLKLKAKSSFPCKIHLEKRANASKLTKSIMRSAEFESESLRKIRGNKVFLGFSEKAVKRQKLS